MSNLFEKRKISFPKHEIDSRGLGRGMGGAARSPTGSTSEEQPQTNLKQSQVAESQSTAITPSKPMPSNFGLGSDPYGIGEGLLVKYISDILAAHEEKNQKGINSLTQEFMKYFASAAPLKKIIQEATHTLQSSTKELRESLDLLKKTDNETQTILDNVSKNMGEMTKACDNLSKSLDEAQAYSKFQIKQAATLVGSIKDYIDKLGSLHTYISVFIAVLFILNIWMTYSLYKINSHFEFLQARQEELIAVHKEVGKYWFDENNHSVYVRWLQQQKAGAK